MRHSIQPFVFDSFVTRSFVCHHGTRRGVYSLQLTITCTHLCCHALSGIHSTLNFNKMPTLVNKETAETADMAWYSANFGVDAKDYVHESACNDSTMSGTMLDDALNDMQQTQAPIKHSTFIDPDETCFSFNNDDLVNAEVVMLAKESNCYTNDNDQSRCHLRAEQLTEMNDSQSNQSREPSGSFMTALTPHCRRTLIEQQSGPNERTYQERYASYVAQKLARARAEHLLIDYHSLTTAEQEQIRVMNLLARLGLHDAAVTAQSSDRSVSFAVARHGEAERQTDAFLQKRKTDCALLAGDDISMEQDSSFEQQNNQSIALLDQTSSDEDVQPYATTKMHSGIKKPSTSSLHEPSRVPHMDTLISTPRGKDSIHASPRRRDYKHNLPSCDTSDSSSTTSIEHTRADRRFSSPETFHRKRMASTSGKRGADHARRRSENDDHTFAAALQSPDRYDESVKKHYDPKFFSPSQYPILQRWTTGDSINHADSSPDSYVPPDMDTSSADERDKFDKHSPQSLPTPADDDSFDDPITNTAYSFQREGQRVLQKSQKHNVGLKIGAVAHFKPLYTKTTHRRRQTFPDPLESYSGSLARRIGRVYERLHRRDMDSNNNATAIVLSVEDQHIQQLTLKVLLTNTPDDCFDAFSRSQQLTPKNDDVKGQTLIVVRERESLENWSRLFREGSAFSVLNHATLPLKQRCTKSTASKLAKYNVVLTTFDSMKSADVTLNVDDNGFVISTGADDGWFESRSTQTATLDAYRAKQLSVLHCIPWERVIFADVIGRKGFLTKPESSRAIAARALNAQRK
jgi:hypothetical protein